MTPITINDPHDFSVYPTNRVCAVINTDMDARSALDALLREGVSEVDIHIFYGSEGVDVLDAEGEHHGTLSKLATKLRSYGDVENETMKRYEEAMRHGGYVFEVVASDDEEKEKVEHILAINAGHEINYFGSWYVEAMSEA
jgi:hypothetical protein